MAIRRCIKRVSGYNVVAHSWNYTVVISPDCYGRDLYLPVACSLLNIKNCIRQSAELFYKIIK